MLSRVLSILTFFQGSRRGDEKKRRSLFRKLTTVCQLNNKKRRESGMIAIIVLGRLGMNFKLDIRRRLELRWNLKTLLSNTLENKKESGRISLVSCLNHCYFLSRASLHAFVPIKIKRTLFPFSSCLLLQFFFSSLGSKFFFNRKYWGVKPWEGFELGEIT